MRKYMKSILACVALIFVFALLPVTAWAEETDDPEAFRNEDPEAYEEMIAQEETEATDADVLYTAPTVTHDSRFDTYTKRLGIDCSGWTSDSSTVTVNWKKVKADGIDFIYFRCGYRGYVYPNLISENNSGKLETYLKAAQKAGIDAGVYFYSQAITKAEAIEEADFAVNLVKASGISEEIPIVMYYQYAYNSGGATGRLYNAINPSGTNATGLTKTQTTAIVAAFCKEVKAKGYTPMVRATTSFLTGVLNADTIAKSADIWLEKTGTTANYTGTYSFWQFATTGTVNGISASKVNLDYQYVAPGTDTGGSSGTDTDTDTTKDSDVDLTSAKDGMIIASSVNFRAKASSTSTTITQIANKTKVKILKKVKDSSGAVWYKVYYDKSGLSSKVGYVADAYIIYTSQIPAAPEITLEALSSSQIKISWGAVKNAAVYQIYSYDYAKKKYVRIKSVKAGTTTYTVTGLSPNTKYKYKVRAYRVLKSTNIYGSCSAYKLTRTLYQTGTIKVKTGVNVRAKASNSSSIVATLSYGKSVSITGTSGNWYAVSFTLLGKTRTGYIYKTYLTVK